MKNAKNRAIKEFLEHHVTKFAKLYRGRLSFAKFIQQEIKNLDNTIWFTSDQSINLDEAQKENKNELEELLNDKYLNAELKNLVGEIVDVNQREFQDELEYQFMENLKYASLSIPDDKSEFRLNLLFLEHNHEPKSYLCGYEDEDYEFKMLSGNEYLKFNYNKELFNGIGGFDYTSFLYPYLNFIEKIGEEKVDVINEAIGMIEYLEEVKKIFILNGFLGMNICLDRIASKIREINLSMKDEVFIFGNEHDCEQLNIYVL